MFEQIDRQKCKWEAAELLQSAQVSPKGMTALYMALVLALRLISAFGGSGFLGIFISILTTLLSSVLAAGFVMYCMAVRRGERAEWSLLFVIPGIIAAYRYRFAEFDLYENPGIGVMEAIDMSKRQTRGYKSQLFVLDLSYFGWMLLASFPTAVLSQMATRDMTMEMLYGIPAPSTYFGLPILALDLICGVWRLLVSLLFFPNYICVELAYFETAKRTSGVGEGAGPSPTWDSWDAPDGLG